MLRRFLKMPSFIAGSILVLVSISSFPATANESDLSNTLVLTQADATLLQNHLLAQLKIANENFANNETASVSAFNISSLGSYPNLMQSVFLLGCQDNLQQWAREHQIELKKLKTLGLVLPMDSTPGPNNVTDKINAL